MIKQFCFNIFGEEVIVRIAPKWAKLYVNGNLSDYTLDSDDTTLMANVPKNIIIKAYITMSYDGHKSNCLLYARTSNDTTEIQPVSVE